MATIQDPWTDDDKRFEAPVRASALAGLSTAICNSFAANPMMESPHVRRHWQNDPFNPWIDTYLGSARELTSEALGSADPTGGSQVDERNYISGTVTVVQNPNLQIGQPFLEQLKERPPASGVAVVHHYLPRERSRHVGFRRNRVNEAAEPDVVFSGHVATVIFQAKHSRPTLRDDIISAAVRWLPSVLTVDFDEELDPDDGEKIPVVVVSTTSTPSAVLDAEPALFDELARKGRSSDWAKYAISYRYR